MPKIFAKKAKSSSPRHTSLGRTEQENFLPVARNFPAPCSNWLRYGLHSATLRVASCTATGFPRRSPYEISVSLSNTPDITAQKSHRENLRSSPDD